MNERERERLISEASELLLQNHGPMHDDITDGFKIDIRLLQFFKTEKGWTLLRQKGWCGFASFYLNLNRKLHECDPEDSEWTTSDEISVTIYNKLIEIDRKLGTSETEQLDYCLFRSTRLDLIKVCLKTKVLTLGLICNHAFIFIFSVLI